MMYDLYIEKQRADINQTLSIQLSYAIDDIRQWGTRNTSFSKSITLPGTAKNNKLFGHVLTNSGANPYSFDIPNINVNFNPADISLCEVRSNGLLVLKGIFRLTGYKLNNGVYEYEGNIFGELGGFVSAIGNKRLEDLDFSAYNHVYNAFNIQGSWDSIVGSGYYYPLIDYGTYSTNKVDYDIRTFRPALYVKEYIDKIFSAAGYTYESSFFGTDHFKSLIIPNNTKRLTKESGSLLDADFSGSQIFTGNGFLEFDTAIGGNFTSTLSNSEFTYNQANGVLTTQTLFIEGIATINNSSATIQVLLNGSILLGEIIVGDNGGVPYNFGGTITFDQFISLNDVIRIRIIVESRGDVELNVLTARFDIVTNPPTIVSVDEGDTVDLNYIIPKGIFQRDFFTWVIKMFNLYITEDKLKEKHLVIEPYIDFYNYSERLDWSQKIDYSKVLAFTPMGQLNGRFFEYKYKTDSDFYNEGYLKKFNQSYGDILHDTGFPFSKEKQTVEIGFSPTPLVQYSGTDKILPAIYKKSTGNDIDQEELTDSNIRILYAKKLTGVIEWDLLDGVTILASTEEYGYAGHLDDPENPSKDLNFGAPSEIYFTVSSYTGNGLYNVYLSSYIEEITNKDSKILSCHAYLKSNDIADLDFSKPIYISGSLWRINKVEDYDAENPVTRVELLKIINADNG